MPGAAAARALLSAKGSSVCQQHVVPRVAVAVRAAAASSTCLTQQRRAHNCHDVLGARGFRTSAAVLTPPSESTSNPATTEEKVSASPPAQNSDKPPSENPQKPAAAANADEVRKAESNKLAETTDRSTENATTSTTTTSSSSSQTPQQQQTPPPQPPAAPNGAAESTAKETPRLSSSRRLRATRLRAAEDVENPPLQVPGWFEEEHVSLYEARPIGQDVLAPLGEADREALLTLEQSRFDGAALTQEDVDLWKKSVSIAVGEEGEGEWIGMHDHPLVNYEALAGELQSRVEDVHRAAFLQLLALVHRRGGKEEEGGEVVVRDHVKKLRQHFLERGGNMMRFPWWKNKLPSGDRISGEVQRWMANLRLDAEIELLEEEEKGLLHASPLAERPESEYSVCMELLTAVRAELWAEIPRGKRREVERPVTVLSILNRKGPSTATSVVDDIATDLKADVVHLDAASIATLVGNHVGQNTYFRRGSISTLGYSAAEMNGRLAPRADGESEQDMGMVTFTLPSRLRSILSAKSTGSTSSMEARWEDVKIVNALEALINAAFVKRLTEGMPVKRRDLIIHLHDYAEINALQSSIINKLRAVVDTMWQKGMRIVLVGSTASDLQKTIQLRDQLMELSQDGHHHVIPFHAAEDGAEVVEKKDNFYENMNNIKNMLQARLGKPAVIDFKMDQVVFMEDCIIPGRWNPKLVEKLSRYVYDAQWVHRLTSIMCGGPVPRANEFGLSSLEYALYFMASRNKFWRDVYPGVKSPYYSPLSMPKPSSSSPSMPSYMSSMSSGTEDSSWMSNLPSSAQSKDFDQHEKKLLSGLINAQDIHTTFNDIIVPQETKESLIGLTSLSLVRPDAFSYGVLKTERIPGCLLYGPPGTGKTLLAKAVAKESGANMLEVSAASINEMWMGQSEKNVRALFSLARKMAPMVIFLDEADALLGARHHAPGRSGHRETITQFLREWDGLSDMRAFIMVATNRPFDLDEAVLRRLPRKILVDLPLATERQSILAVMLREEQLGTDVDLAQLARETELYSGSDLKNLCVSAAMEAVRDECRAQEAHNRLEEEAKPEAAERTPYEFPAKRVLTRRHFDKGLREISASISEDMDSLKAIRKFDEQYGDAGRQRKRRRSGIGFEVIKEHHGSEEARVRQVVGAPPPPSPPSTPAPMEPKPQTRPEPVPS